MANRPLRRPRRTSGHRQILESGDPHPLQAFLEQIGSVDTVQTYLDLLRNRQSIRLEWYIVILIAAEIMLILYEIFVAG